MISTKRFFEPDAPEMPSVASLMASKGTRIGAEAQVEVPVISIKKDTKETAETPVEKVTPVETTTLPSPTETAKPEIPATPEAKTLEAKTPQTEERPKAEVPKQTVLKQQPTDQVLKDLGLDAEMVKLAKEIAGNQKMKAFYENWLNKGDVTSYLKAVTTDFSKMKPEEVMRHQLREANPDLDEKQLGILFKKKVTERYKQDPELYSADEIEEGYVEMMADVKPMRQSLQAEQEKLFLPTPPEKEPPVDIAAEQAQKKEEAIQEVKRMIVADPLYREVLQNKKLTIGEGESAYHFPMKDPEAALSVLYDEVQMSSKLFDESDLPIMETQLILAAILQEGPKKFFKNLAKHYQSIGGQAAIAPVENPSQPGNIVSPAEKSYKSIAEAMAKAGRKVTGGDY